MRDVPEELEFDEWVGSRLNLVSEAIEGGRDDPGLRLLIGGRRITGPSMRTHGRHRRSSMP